MKKRYSLIAALLLIAVMLAGCSKSMSDNAYYKSGSSAAPSAAKATESFYGYSDEAATQAYAPNDAKTDAPGSAAPVDTDGSSTNASQPASGRKLIRRVNLSVESLEFEQSINTLESSVGAFGGYIESSSITDRNSYYGINNYRNSRVASYVIRIPSEMLDGFLNQVGNIGNITSQSTSAEDITLSYLDLEARTESLEIQQERLLALLEKAETVDEIISLEDRLSTVRYQIEAQRSTLKNYDNLVAFSTVTIGLTEVVKITEPEPTTMGQRISRGLSDTFYDLGVGLENFAVGFVVNLPYILIWALIIFVIIFVIVKIVKGTKKRRAKKQEQLQAKLQADWAARQAAQQNNERNTDK
ncbi:MAG: DUF4349 domain-containing protein [Lachnospiraceae bacterium]|nr:DUF4349 domain-containing protein [Lachnospiraceae bacterium]